MRRIDDTELAAQTIRRIKVMARLDIAERRVPQDGRLQIACADRSIDVRVSIMPSIHGEDAVLRILEQDFSIHDIACTTDSADSSPVARFALAAQRKHEHDVDLADMAVERNVAA